MIHFCPSCYAKKGHRLMGCTTHDIHAKDDEKRRPREHALSCTVCSWTGNAEDCPKSDKPNPEYWGLTELEMKEMRTPSRKILYYNAIPQREVKHGGRIKVRWLHAPTPRLKDAQHLILRTVLYKHARAADPAHGFVHGRSNATSAAKHVGQDVVVCMDLKDFFPSVSKELLEEGFERCSKALRQRKEDILDICMLDGGLPQGAPTSPALSNIAVASLDEQLKGFNEKHLWAKYTRFADDFAFSSREECATCPHNAHRMLYGTYRKKTDRTMCGQITWKDENGKEKSMPPCHMAGNKLARMIPAYQKIMEDNKYHGLKVNALKTRVRYPHQQQRVHGLVVNAGMDVPRVERKVRRQVRWWIHQALTDVVFNRPQRHDVRKLQGHVAYILGVHRPHGEPLQAKINLLRRCLSDKRTRSIVRKEFQERESFLQIDREAA